MGVLMVDIRKVRMPVPQRLMPVFVSMRFTAVPGRSVLVLMMRIVRVCMTMDQRLVNMLVFVSLSQMQPNTNCHACGCDPERPSDRLAIEENGHAAADEGHRCEVRARPCGFQITKCEDEQHRAQSVTQKSKNERRPHLSRRRQSGLERQGQPNIGRTRGKPFCGSDRAGICSGDLPGEIIVQDPK